MELNLHPIATKSFVSGHEFVENERVVSYLVRPFVPPTAQARDEAKPAFARYDLLESEDRPAFGKGDFSLSAGSTSSPQAGSEEADSKQTSSITLDFVYCRWITEYKPRKEGNSAQALKLTAENLFLTLAIPAGSLSSTEIESGLQAVNTPLLQFLALMMERKKQIKPVGKTEDGLRHIYEHRASHALYEVPVGDLNVEFFQKIQEHLGVLVGNPKPKNPPAAPAEPVAASGTPV